MFLATFSDEEVKQVVWDYVIGKSPEPNGFNLKFIQ